MSLHARRDTVELVIADSVLINNLQIYDVGLSKHKVNSIDLTFLSPPRKPRLSVKLFFWNWKSIDPAIITMDLQYIACASLVVRMHV